MIRNYLLKRGTTEVAVGDLYFADPSLFDVFSFELLQGDSTNALRSE